MFSLARLGGVSQSVNGAFEGLRSHPMNRLSLENRNDVARRPMGHRLAASLVAALALAGCGSTRSGNKGTPAGAGGAAGAANGPGGSISGNLGGQTASVTSGGAPGSMLGGAAGTASGSGGSSSPGGTTASGGQTGLGGTVGAGGAAGAAGTSGAAGAASSAADAGAGACTRADLKSVVGVYFTAMAAHDPTMLKVASSVKFTENAKSLELGDGLWKTAGAVTFHRDVLDTERCGAVSESVVDNQGTATIFGLRLRLEGGQLTEVETIVVDPKTGFFPTPTGIVNSSKDDWEGVLPADQRSTRAELTAAANAYFDLFSNPSTMVPFAKPCNRLENGLQTTQGDCGGGIPSGNLMMTHRRYPVADLEAGIAVGWVLFGGGLLDFHMFKLKGGKIQFINAVVGPSATSWGWPDDPP